MNIVRWNIIVEDMLRNDIEQSEERCYLYFIFIESVGKFAHTDCKLSTLTLICVRLMDFIIFVLFYKGVDGTDFLAGFATG